MIKYHWHDEASESFGMVKRPVAEVYVRDKNGIWRALTMYVDSGADVSIMMRSFGELFGHDLKKGRKIRLKGIGPIHITAYVHRMEILVGRHMAAIDVAIAEDDSVPNVLGRRGLFDLFEIQFKNVEKQTWFLRR